VSLLRLMCISVAGEYDPALFEVFAQREVPQQPSSVEKNCRLEEVPGDRLIPAIRPGFIGSEKSGTVKITRRSGLCNGRETANGNGVS
jgi:hypothetical protein